MGRYIYGEQVGSSADDTIVHKFWVAVQASDVSDYLETDEYEPFKRQANLAVSDEHAIKATVLELKKAFRKEYGVSYETFMDSDLSGEPRIGEKLASRINLGEHLLATIQNMRAAGIEKQQLIIET